MVQVAELITYPVKGCAGVPVTDALLTLAGLDHDRSFMVTDVHGVYRTQRHHPRLALIRPEIGEDGSWLALRAPGNGVVRIDVDVTGARRDVDLFGQRYRGIDQGDEVAGWLSEMLGFQSRLVRVPPEHDRVVSGDTPGTSGYADSSPVHLLSQSSWDTLSERMSLRGVEPVPMNRFRPNIVVAGWAEPHTEDRARRVTVADTELGFAKLAIRCVVTTVQQESGAKSGPEPLSTLATYRRATQGGIAFGAKFAVLRQGKLAIGDELVVNTWAESEL